MCQVTGLRNLRDSSQIKLLYFSNGVGFQAGYLCWPCWLTRMPCFFCSSGYLKTWLYYKRAGTLLYTLASDMHNCAFLSTQGIILTFYKNNLFAASQSLSLTNRNLINPAEFIGYQSIQPGQSEPLRSCFVKNSISWKSEWHCINRIWL